MLRRELVARRVRLGRSIVTIAAVGLALACVATLGPTFLPAADEPATNDAQAIAADDGLSGAVAQKERPSVGRARSAVSNSRDPADAVAGLDVYQGLEATLFASEPTLTNPTNIDIDARGRVWVCDVANYRGHNGERPAGDRILILEDTDGDGKSDKSTVYYQGKDLISPQGICVLGKKVIVSASPNIWVFTDENGDDKPDKKEALFTKTGDAQHDHSAHSFVFGPDGKLYWNFGNSGHRVCDKNGNVIVDKAGNRVEDNGKPYRQGMVFRCNEDGGDFEVLAHNFRNNYEVCVDSFGNVWQSDNDDDGNKSVRINYVMEGGNYGYTDELTGAGWQSPRTNLEQEIPARHWHQNDPGVVPNMLITGAGSPAGICVYEGDLLPKLFHGNLIHCEPGHNVVRCYRTAKDGAGFKVTETVDILKGVRDNWFRPADVCVAPDGSLFVSDWYDPGVGGHAQGDTGRGRIFRVAPKGKKYELPGVPANKVKAVQALVSSPCLASRYVARDQYKQATPVEKKNVLELLGGIASRKRTNDDAAGYVRTIHLLNGLDAPGLLKLNSLFSEVNALHDSDSRVQVAAWRSVHVGTNFTDEDFRDLDYSDIDSMPVEVRREMAVSLRRTQIPSSSLLWSAFAAKYDAKDRWFLEALGIGAANKWDACLDAWLEKVGDKWNTPAGRDIIWRSRAKKTPAYLAKIIAHPSVPAAELPRYFRAFDFQAASPDKEAALVELASADAPGDAARGTLVATESLKRLPELDIGKVPKASAALSRVLDNVRGTSQFVDLVSRFNVSARYPELLALAQKDPESQLGVDAMRALLSKNRTLLIEEGLADKDAAVAAATAQALGNGADNRSVAILMPIVKDKSRPSAVRQQAARGLAKTRGGAQQLVAMLKSNQLDDDVKLAPAIELSTAPWDDVRAEAAKLFPPPAARNDRPLPPIADLIRSKGNAGRGKIVFETTGTCAKCHVVGGQGKEVGPDLSEVGGKLSRQALVESVVFPSAGISHNYETHVLSTTDGNQVVGIVTSRTPAEVTIKTQDAIVRTFRTAEIDAIKKQNLSLMPADLQKLMTAQELVDVVEYMSTLKKRAN